MWHLLLAWWSFGVVGTLLVAAALFLYVHGWNGVAGLLAGAAVAYGATTIVYQHGRADEAVAVAAATAREEARETAIYTGQVAALQTQLESATADDATNQQSIAAYVAELAAKPAVQACTIGADDAAHINGH